MKTQFNILRKTRELVLKNIEGLTHEQLHVIPEGFKNNIIWNITHLVVTQQLLHYKLSDLQCLVPDELIDAYRKGTFPSETISEEDFEDIKELFLGLPDTLEEDFNANIFETYQEYPTSTGYVLTDIQTAIAFNNLHEAMHLGVIMSLKKLV